MAGPGCGVVLGVRYGLRGADIQAHVLITICEWRDGLTTHASPVSPVSVSLDLTTVVHDLFRSPGSASAVAYRIPYEVSVLYGYAKM